MSEAHSSTSRTATSPATGSRPARRRVPSWLILLLIVGLFGLALYLGRPAGEEEGFGGTDAMATEQISEAHPGYEPWFQPFFSPSGGEVESGLFALQAALGAGAAGFILGTLRERRRARGHAADPAGTPAASVAADGSGSGADAPR